MSAEEIAKEYIGLIPTPEGDWGELRNELTDKIDGYAQMFNLQRQPLFCQCNVS